MEGDVIVSPSDAATELPAEVAEVAAPTNEFQEKYERLAMLERYVDAVGGPEALIELARAGHSYQNDPQIQAVLRAATEKPPEPEEEIYDPEVKALKGRYDPIIQNLQQQNADLQSRLTKAEVSSLKTVLTGNVEAALSTFKETRTCSSRPRLTSTERLRRPSSLRREAIRTPSSSSNS